MLGGKTATFFNNVPVWDKTNYSLYFFLMFKYIWKNRPQKFSLITFTM